MTAIHESGAVARAVSQRDPEGRICPVCELDSDSTLDYCPRDGVRLVDPQRALRSRVGTVIDGRFTLLDFVGSGGMGAVYAARQHALDRLVAVKLVHSARALNSSDLKRFFAEARAVSRLSHPNVVSVFESGQTDSGDLYLVMELIDGETLAARLKHVTRLPLNAALRLAEGLCAALQHAHDRGVVHRDIKPANVLLVPGVTPGQDLVKVVDFGVAKLTEGDSSHSTGTGKSPGTPAYMSPEQALGRPVDARSDVYSAAVVLYEALTGVRPFSGVTAQDVVNAHAFEQPPLLRLPDRAPDLPPAIERVILGALSKSPDLRPASPRELLTALQDAASGVSPSLGAASIDTTGAPPRAVAPVSTTACTAGPSVEDSDVDWPGHPAPPRRRGRSRVVAVAFVALVAVAGLAWPRQDGEASSSHGDSSPVSGAVPEVEAPKVARRGPEESAGARQRWSIASAVATAPSPPLVAPTPSPGRLESPAPAPLKARPVTSRPARRERIVE